MENTSSNSNQQQEENSFWHFIKSHWVISLVILCFVLGSIYLFTGLRVFDLEIIKAHLKYATNCNFLGTYGDFIGGTLGTFIAGLACWLVYKTYISQKEELDATKSIMDEQSKTMKQQQFETSFYNLLGLRKTLLNELIYNTFEFDKGLSDDEKIKKRKMSETERIENGDTECGLFAIQETYYRVLKLSDKIKCKDEKSDLYNFEINLHDSYCRELYCNTLVILKSLDNYKQTTQSDISLYLIIFFSQTIIYEWNLASLFKDYGNVYFEIDKLKDKIVTESKFDLLSLCYKVKKSSNRYI